ncbi:MAG: M20/M25/M40 family metallo-hydrolase [Gemmatimonadales bacterium]
MASTSPAEIELLHALVATPSVSGTEEVLGRWVETEARAWGLDVSRDERGVLVEVSGRTAGPTLAFASHLDTVPPGEGWTRDPFTPVVLDGKLYGRGSGDAKASVAAMLAAARDLAGQGGPATGRLVVLLGYGEETRHTSMPALVARAGRVDAAVVGEPTNLDVAIAQRGLMMVDLVSRGDQRHAGYAADGKFTNAVTALAADLLVLGSVAQDRPHPLLGQPTITATMVEAGVSRNVTPPTAKAVLDVRSTPAWSHEELAAELKARLTSEVVVTSDRLVPCETRSGSALLAAVLRARPAARTFGSPTCSDWVFLRGSDAVKCGPGTSRRSHTADECVDLAEVTEARTFYARVAKEYLG